MYISVELKNNVFAINQVSNKPQEHDLALDTLEKLKLILDAKMKPEEGTAFATLSKQELRSKIKELSSEIAGKYEAKRIRCEWRICRVIGEILCRIGLARLFPFLATQKKVEALQQAILSHVSPTKKLLKGLVEDTKFVILGYLEIADLKKVNLVCKNALASANKVLFNRARSFGYQGNNTAVQVHGYLNMLQKGIEKSANRMSLMYRYAFEILQAHNATAYAKVLSQFSHSLDSPTGWERVVRNFTRYSSDEMIELLSIFHDACGFRSSLIRLFLQCTQSGIIQGTSTAADLVSMRDALLYSACVGQKREEQAAALLFILHGADLEKQGDPAGLTPLAVSSHYGHKKIVSLLLEHGAKPNNPARNGNCPLHFAAQQGKDDVVQLLLDKKALINVPGSKNQTALLCAVRARKLSTVQLLLDNGADSSIPQLNNSAPLHFAAQQGDLEIVVALLDSGANIDSLGMNGKTALHLSAATGKTAVVKELLRRGADPLIPDVHGSYPLHLAVQGGHVDVVPELLLYMPGLRVPGAGGHTAV
jgi:ankyrin repeat protein